MKAKYILLSAIAVVALSSCNDFLDSEDLTKKDNSNFPKTEDDAQQSSLAVIICCAMRATAKSSRT
jgi:hypothetical protein